MTRLWRKHYFIRVQK